MKRRWKFLFSMLVLSGVSLLVAAFRLLWIRYEIQSEAKSVAELEYQGSQAKDQLRMLESTVLESVQPHILRERIDGTMDHPREGQVIRVDGFGEQATKSSSAEGRVAA